VQSQQTVVNLIKYCINAGGADVFESTSVIGMELVVDLTAVDGNVHAAHKCKSDAFGSRRIRSVKSSIERAQRRFWQAQVCKASRNALLAAQWHC
jgi:hypothetical protein